MKKLMEKTKMPVMSGFLVEEKADIKKGVKELKFPLVAKSDMGVDTVVLQTKEDIAKFESKFNPEIPYFLEPVITGDIVTYDGLVDDYANIVNGEAYEQKEDNGKQCVAITRRSEIDYVFSEEELYNRYRENIVIRLENPHAFRDLQGVHLYDFVGFYRS